MLSASARKSKLVATNKKGKATSAAVSTAAAVASPAHSVGRGTILTTTTRNQGRGEGLALGAKAAFRTLGGGGGSAATASRPFSRAPCNDVMTAPSSIGGSGEGSFLGSVSSGFPFPPSPSTVDLSSPSFMRSTAWDPSWDKDPRPPGGFMSYFGNQPHNFHLVGAPVHNQEGISPVEVETLDEQQTELVDSDVENVRTEKRIAWKEDEDVSLMSSWIEHSTDSTCGADRSGSQYWSEVVESYNKTAPPLRKRNMKQCKDRWHTINKWCDLFECAYVKAHRVFTSGYSKQMWIDAAHKFYVADNKEAKLGPFILMEVWKTCRDVAKWKTYNEELRNARKRKAFNLEGDNVEHDQNVDEMPERPMGQKAAKRLALLAAKGQYAIDGKLKEPSFGDEKVDKLDKIKEINASRMKQLELQQKLSSDKVEATKLAHLTTQENREAKKIEMEARKFEMESKRLEMEGKKLEMEQKKLEMELEAYNNLISQDTSSMTDDEKTERVAAMKCLRKILFPEII